MSKFTTGKTMHCQSFILLIQVLVIILLHGEQFLKDDGIYNFSSAGEAETEDYQDEYVEDGNDEDGKGGEQPVITTIPKPIDVVEGDDIRLECKGRHLDQYALIWTKVPGKIISIGGETLSKNDSLRIENLEKETVLLIKNATLSDAGSYNCTVLWNVTIVQTVNVRARDKKVMGPYLTLSPAGYHVVDQEDSLNLTCTVRTEGKQIQFFWQKKNQKDAKNKKFEDTVVTRTSKTTVENTLILKSISRHDAGDYVCVFQDDIGTTESTVRLDVNFSPVIETRRDAVHSGIGKSVELRCIVHGQPRPTLTWYKSDRLNKTLLVPITNRAGYQIRSDHHTHILSIVSLKQSDYGTYTCEARNGFSKAGIAVIEVTGAPSQPVLVEDKTKLGEEHMTYDLVWKVESSIPIETNALRFRREPEPEWNDVYVEGTRLPNQPSFYEVAYTLVNLTSSSNYEATLLSKNEFGWSIEARVHRFSINGKSFTKTNKLELNDDKEGKASGTTGNSLLVSVSIFLFCLIRRW